MIILDGSLGEGGGQILRTALGLSLLTGEPFVLENIRARRTKPGLRQQHLTAVLAAAEVGRASVDGAQVGSRRLAFHSRAVAPGDYRFSVGTAGSTTLVFQALLPALLAAEGPSRLVLEGGTHNPWAPPLDFIDRVFLPVLERMGANVRATLHRHGFFPAGGGRVEFCVEPAPVLNPPKLRERGELRGRVVRALVARLPESIAQRELRVVAEKLGWPGDCLKAESVDSPGPGNVVMIEMQFAETAEMFVGFGQKGVSAERVAAAAARQARQWLDSGAPVGPHLADQLLIPLAMAGGGSFVTVEPTTHTTTNIEVIGRFLDVDFPMEQRPDGLLEIRVERSG